MQAGGTVADGMRRHLVTLERERKSLEQSIQLCQSLKEREERLDALDAAALLDEMEQLEQRGTTFQDKQKNDLKPVRYIGAIVMALLTTALMVGLIGLRVWGCTGGCDGVHSHCGHSGGAAGPVPADQRDSEGRGRGCETLLTVQSWPGRRFSPL